ncbi:Aldehyde oxidase GLOX [Psilocybe cubensis]|uniref:Aldehyde oxidase GLOX n=2 Tax=Psilocybe cubensis TaxID=181762 RepID=A0ACB8GUD2_PSICU|nr:Aldehyde oxidase GLOX [Psilocybe cubensis]KAH9479085.1 Aldehyde oxidase GLOX [Psilocybe cubensis]
MRRHFYVITLTLRFALAQSPTTIAAPGQPTHKGETGKFELLDNSIVSAQQLFLGRVDKVYLIDKVENNPNQINGHPAWASEYRLSDNRQRALDIPTNTFCAGGSVLGNGTWINVGGNQAVTSGGNPAATQDGRSGPYMDADGRRMIRLLNPCDGDDCSWTTSGYQSEQRWYPTLETLEDGSVIIIGGSKNGGYLNDAGQTNPTYEFFPPSGPAIRSNFLENTLPANLYPLTWLLPSGKLLVQAMRSTILLDHKTKVETPLDDMPDAVRTYPASAGTVMMPLTPANNWTATIMFCGGSDVPTDQWASPKFVPISQAAATSCVKIAPDVSGTYVNDDPLPERRSMASLILLPDGKILCLNGAKTGTAGYGTTSWSIGQSYADDPVLLPVLYNPDAAAGSRWSSNGLSPSTVPRMYHSSATLLPDGSVFVSGSNPNADYASASDVLFPTEYRTERFYPPYYNERRPQPKGLINKLSYGGPPFEVVLDADDLFKDVQNVDSARVVVIRTGFSTHAINMGQRMIVLQSTYSGFSNTTAVLHVSQMPPNPAIFPPGPAWMFLVVKGIPSVGVQVMVGSGNIETQNILPIASLPDAMIYRADDTTSSSSGASSTSSATDGQSQKTSSAVRLDCWLALRCLSLWSVALLSLSLLLRG